MHQYFVFNASRGVSCKLYVLFGAKRVDRLYQSYRTDRNKVLNPHARIFKLFRYVHHKSQVVNYQFLPYAVVSCRYFPDYSLLLLL